MVADVATGTAIWLIDLARDQPDAQLDGFDIDTTQAPHQRWLPRNISVKRWDICTDPPRDMIGKYDVVHVRLLVLVISDPRPTVKRLAKLLKPGGYLQWDELNCKDVRVKKVDADELQPTPALDQLRDMSWAGGRHDWTLQIPAVLEEKGFEKAFIYHFDDRDDMVRIIHEQHMVTMEEFARKLMSQGKAAAGRTVMQVVATANEEAKLGAVLSFPRFVCVARKSP